MLLKKHTWVMKEKEGVQAEKASMTQRNSRWVRGGRRERNVMGKKEQQTFFSLRAIGEDTNFATK